MKELRSIRKFKSDMVPQKIIDQIMEAGLYAASGKGEQAAIVIQISCWAERTGLLMCTMGAWSWET
mgnify:CR=1 FL=1